jgi:hypothetical protein
MTYLDEKYELVDHNKIVRICLGIDNTNNPYLSLFDAEGRERCILSLDGDGNGSLGFRTAKGQPTVNLGSGIMMLDVQNEISMSIVIVNNSCHIRLDTTNGVYLWPAPDAKPLAGKGDVTDYGKVDKQ